MARSIPAFRTHPEHRWPVVLALVVALALYMYGPTSAFSWVRPTVVALCAAVMIALIFLNPRHLNRETRESRIAAIALAFVLLGANQFALVELVHRLATGAGDGQTLLLSAVQVWVTNVIAYAIVYWEIDRGGPVARRREARSAQPAASFQFPQDAQPESGWEPAFIDYLYFSATNSMAFSPTDTMPLTPWAKWLMMWEGFSGFVVLALVIARAVNILA